MNESSESNLYHMYFVIPFGITVSNYIKKRDHPSVRERSVWVVEDVSPYWYCQTGTKEYDFHVVKSISKMIKNATLSVA